jgi:hypothetical protein
MASNIDGAVCGDSRIGNLVSELYGPRDVSARATKGDDAKPNQSGRNYQQSEQHRYNRNQPPSLSPASARWSH